MNYCILTTINPPTESVKVLHEKFGGNLIVVGDKKTPKDWKYKTAEFYSHDLVSSSECPLVMPDNHYARKNLGYMIAIKTGAELIYDIDDDNCPNENWKIRTGNVAAIEEKHEGWLNVYNYFTDENIWPRGFSLKKIHELQGRFSEVKNFYSPIQQGIADGDADVDAIWRLTQDRPISFDEKKSIYLSKNVWCPFNSQTTWFFKEAFPLLYLPIYAPFRMTDIWRSFVAQRCLWELGFGVTFHSPSEVFQDRNPHDLMKDFEGEISGYLKNDLIVETLSALQLKTGQENIYWNMMACYQSLVNIKVLPEEEMESLKKWIAAI